MNSIKLPPATSVDESVVDRRSTSEVAGREEQVDRFASRFGTPCYLYDADEIRARIEELRRALPEETESKIYYSFKANPNPAVAAEMKEGGCRADLTSPGEILAAREAGFDLGSALYGGPGKSVDELLDAISAGIRHFSVESRPGLAALDRAAQTSGEVVNAILRVNPHEAPRAKLAMSGVASQFGFEEAELRAGGREMLGTSREFVKPRGIHIYWGTQIGEVADLLTSFSETVRIAAELCECLDFPLEILNLGGGFPWPYATEGRGPDLSALAEGLANLVSRSGKAAKAQWWFESGRYLSASSGTLVSRVMETKESKEGKRFLILDTGIHHLGGMSGLGRIPRFSIDIQVPPERRKSDRHPVDVVGQLCTPLDCIGRRLNLPELQPGDLVSIPNTGAYGPTASVTAFLSRPSPAEILHRKGRVLAANRLRGGHENIS